MIKFFAPGAKLSGNGLCSKNNYTPMKMELSILRIIGMKTGL